MYKLNLKLKYDYTASEILIRDEKDIIFDKLYRLTCLFKQWKTTFLIVLNFVA